MLPLELVVQRWFPLPVPILLGQLILPPKDRNAPPSAPQLLSQAQSEAFFLVYMGHPSSVSHLYLCSEIWALILTFFFFLIFPKDPLECFFL